ncbi:hypothetical protein [Lentisphaera marina]|uniref:beta-propeller domain-containing protein n=1 Tax=Lentisphaera marina TaxID=1111041 RepID=UPI003B6811D1
MAINGPKAIIEMSPEGKIRKMIKLPYLRSQLRHQMKMVRKLDDGGYIVSASGENKVFILNSKGNIQRVIDLNKLEAPLKAKRIHGVKMLDNGNVLVGTGYGACLVEIDPNDKIVWSLTPQDVPDIKLTYVGGFQIRENGNLIIAAYDSQYPVFELTREKTIVWKIKRGETKEVNKPSNIVLIGDDIEGFAANY